MEAVGKLYKIELNEGAKCPGCGWDTKRLYVIADSKEEVIDLVLSGDAGLCGECIAEVIHKTSSPVIGGETISEDEVTKKLAEYRLKLELTPESEEDIDKTLEDPLLPVVQAVEEVLLWNEEDILEYLEALEERFEFGSTYDEDEDKLLVSVDLGTHPVGATVEEILDDALEEFPEDNRSKFIKALQKAMYLETTEFDGSLAEYLECLR